MAISQSALCRLSRASLSAVREEEHAMLGPVRLRQKETVEDD